METPKMMRTVMAEMSDISESMVKVEPPNEEDVPSESTETADTVNESVSIPEQSDEQETSLPDMTDITESMVKVELPDQTVNPVKIEEQTPEPTVQTETPESVESTPDADTQPDTHPEIETPTEVDTSTLVNKDEITESIHIEDAKDDHYSSCTPEPTPEVAPAPQEGKTTEAVGSTRRSGDEDTASSEGETDPFVMVKKDEVPSVEALKEPEEAEHQAECHLLQEDSKATKKEEDEWLQVLGHEKLMKKVLKRGEGVESRPVHGNTVTIRCVGRLASGEEVDKDNSLTFVLGDGDVIQALDLCVGLMERGEVAEIVTYPQYAYGSVGRQPDIPGDVTLTYEVEVLLAVKSPVYKELPIPERVRLADLKRERGNFLYTRTEHAAAINSYTKALKILDDSGESHNDVPLSDIQSLVDMRVKCYNNLAAAQIKIEAWDVALKSCDETLKVQPENVKALFRKGKCLEGKGETDAAIICFKKAVKLDPEAKIIQQELLRLTARQKVQQKSEREMYQKMLGTDKQSKKETQEPDEESWWKYGVAGAVVLGAAAVGAAFYKSST